MPASEETSSLSRWTRRPTDNSIDDADAVMVVSRPIAVTAEAAGGAQPLRSGPVLRRTTIDQAPTSRSQASASLAGDLSDVVRRRRPSSIGLVSMLAAPIVARRGTLEVAWNRTLGYADSVLSVPGQIAHNK